MVKGDENFPIFGPLIQKMTFSIPPDTTKIHFQDPLTKNSISRTTYTKNDVQILTLQKSSKSYESFGHF